MNSAYQHTSQNVSAISAGRAEFMLPSVSMSMR